jgi:L-threonylcarbamoyladenylate synthase
MKTELLSVKRTVAIPHALDILRHGGMVVFPTDTVYGLATLPFKADVIEQLYTAKGRSNEKAIAVLIGEMAHLERIASSMSALAQRLAQAFWPGPLTLVVSRNSSLPDVLSPLPTIGVRMPNHPVALKLLRSAGPLAVTSANLSGWAAPCTAQDALRQLNGRVHLILDGGKTPGGVPSTVVDCTTPEAKVLRQGPITSDQIFTALKDGYSSH